MNIDEVIGGIVAMIMWCDHQRDIAYEGDKQIYTEHGMILRGALMFLMVQDPVSPTKDKLNYYYCGNCGCQFRSKATNFCPECGREVKWE